MRMANACFKSKTLGGVRGANNSLGHCSREYSGRGKEPDYLLPKEHRLANKTEVFITPDELMAEMKNNGNGKAPVNAKPFREAVILLNENTTDLQIDNCIEALCRKLEVRKMYVSVHNDEGHINEKGEVIYNRHLHFGYTNYRAADHKMVHIDKTKMKAAQDICARELAMERGIPKKETGIIGVGHKTWRQDSRAAEHLSADWERWSNQQTKILEDKNKELEVALTKLKAENAELRTGRSEERAALKASPGARQIDYQNLKRKHDALDAENKRQQKEIESLKEQNERLEKEFQKTKERMLEWAECAVRITADWFISDIKKATNMSELENLETELKGSRYLYEFKAPFVKPYREKVEACLTERRQELTPTPEPIPPRSRGRGR